MKTLSQFLAEHTLDRKDFDEKEWPEMIKYYGELITEGIEAYKEHLQKDCPKTVHWAMIEKQIVEALTKAEQMPATPKDEKVCANPEWNMNMGCNECPVEKCKQRLVNGTFSADQLLELSAKAASTNKVKEICFDPELRAEIGCDDCDARNTCKAKTNLKDIAHPICPLNMYFEGDEHKCNADKCDFDIESRSCNSGCQINKIEQTEVNNGN